VAANKHRVAITIEGGVVQSIASDSRNIDVFVLDYDSLETDWDFLPQPIAEPRDDVEYGTRAIDSAKRCWVEAVRNERAERAGTS
jgi:hypothetical protein